MQDILSLFVSNDAAFSFIKKTYRVNFILLICNITYALLGLIEWFRYMQRIPSGVPHYFYNYIIWPSITMLDLVLIIAGSVLNYRSYSHLMSAVKKSNDALLVAAFKRFYFTSCIFLVSTSLLLIDAGFRILFVW